MNIESGSGSESEIDININNNSQTMIDDVASEEPSKPIGMYLLLYDFVV